MTVNTIHIVSDTERARCIGLGTTKHFPKSLLVENKEDVYVVAKRR